MPMTAGDQAWTKPTDMEGEGVSNQDSPIQMHQFQRYTLCWFCTRIIYRNSKLRSGSVRTWWQRLFMSSTQLLQWVIWLLCTHDDRKKNDKKHIVVVKCERTQGSQRTLQVSIINLWSIPLPEKIAEWFKLRNRIFYFFRKTTWNQNIFTFFNWDWNCW